MTFRAWFILSSLSWTIGVKHHAVDSPNQHVIPVIVLNRDRFTYLKKGLHRYKQLTTPHKVYVLDLGSSYPPMLEYLKQFDGGCNDPDNTETTCVVSSASTYCSQLKERQGGEAYQPVAGTELPCLEHHAPSGMEKLVGLVNALLHEIPKSKTGHVISKYVVTDSDCVWPEETPHDVLDVYKQILDDHPEKVQVGPALRLSDIPDSNKNKEAIIDWERQFWDQTGIFHHGGKEVPLYCKAHLDTTMSMWRGSVSYHSTMESCRIGGHYEIQHLDWYQKFSDMPEDLRWYMDHRDRTIGGHYLTFKTDDSTITAKVKLSNRFQNFEQEITHPMMAIPPGDIMPWILGISIIFTIAAATICIDWALTVLKICVFLVTGSGLILLNKHILNELDFPYPLTLSGLGMLATSLMVRCSVDVLGVGKVSSQTLKEFAGEAWYMQVLPIAFAKSLTLSLGNAVYLYLGLGFIQMLKSLNPAIVATATAIFGLTRPSRGTLFYVGLIVLGTMAEVGGELHYTVFGLTIMLLSECFEAMHLVLTQKLLQTKIDVVEGLYILTPPGCMFLFAIAAVLEWPEMYMQGDYKIMALYPVHFTVQALMGLAVNWLSLSVMQATSALSLKILISVRSVGLVIIGASFYGEEVTLLEIGGFCIALIGFMGYSWVQADSTSNKQ